METFAIIMGLIFIAVWFVLHPSRACQGTRAMFMGVNCAHRGLHTPDKTVPENSLPAFRAAVRMGYGVELDVQLTRDGHVVVFHDDTVLRVCGREGRVDDYTLQQIRRFHLCGTDETIPLFQEVLDVLNAKVPMIVELKTGPRNKELCQKTLAILNDYAGVYCIESFDPRIVRWFKKHARGVLRGQLTDASQTFKDKPKLLAFCLSNCLTNVLARPHFIAHGPGKKSWAVRAAEQMGAMSVRWTVRAEDDIETLQNENDVLIFEFYMPEANLQHRFT